MPLARSMHYSGERAVVTGASGGIGRALVDELLAGGADVAAICRSRLEALEPLTARAAALGRRCLPYAVDLREAAAVAEICNRLIAEFGPPTIVVAGAGIVRDRPLATMPTADWDDVVSTNLAGPFHLLRGLVPAMIRNGGGRVLNVASISGLFGQPGQAAYAAAKGGLIAMTRALARELGPLGITVNALAPGVVDTEMTGHLTDAVRRRYLERIPLRRFATPADLVPAARLLMAREGSYITGQVLIVDGGMTS